MSQTYWNNRTCRRSFRYKTSRTANNSWPQSIHSLPFQVASHGIIVVLPRPSPGGPSPDVIPVGKEIRGFALFTQSGREGRTADGHDARVMAVSFQQFRTESKESRPGEGVIFQDNTFLHVLEKPGNCSRYARTASQIRVPEKRMHLTRPVNFRHDPSAFRASLGFAFLVRAWSISCNEQLPGASGPDRLKDTAGRVRTAEDQEKYRCVYVRLKVHFFNSPYCLSHL